MTPRSTKCVKIGYGKNESVLLDIAVDKIKIENGREGFAESKLFSIFQEKACENRTHVLL